MSLTSLPRFVARIGAACAVLCMTAPAAFASINWDGDSGTNWWFDPANWSQDNPTTDAPCPCLPPSQDDGAGAVTFTDAQVNGGTGAWNVTGEGVVYDPDNDPFFAAAASLPYATGSGVTAVGFPDYGPQSLYRLYLSRNATMGESNLITIKSGDMVIESTTIIGRSGSTAGNLSYGQIDQVGGRVSLPLTALDIGNSETSGWGNGTYRYLGGTLDVSIEGGAGIRLAHGRSGTGPSGVNRFVIGNPSGGGHIRTWDYISISWRGEGTDGTFVEGLDPDGVSRGVATTEFLFQNGGFRPMQVGRNVTLNNGVEQNTGGVLSSRLVLTLDEAPAVDGSGVPSDFGLFDVDFDLGFGNVGGIVNGFGDIDNDTFTDAVFANEDGSQYYLEGDTVSAMFGGTRYDWTISYSGDITWTDADNSVVGSISGSGSGGDIVLIGLGSESVAMPLDGDFNADGKVDILDLDILSGNFGTSGGATLSQGDANGDGNVDILDLDILSGNFGAMQMASASIPEPGTLGLGLLSVLATLQIGRRRK